MTPKEAWDLIKKEIHLQNCRFTTQDTGRQQREEAIEVLGRWIKNAAIREEM